VTYMDSELLNVGVNCRPLQVLPQGSETGNRCETTQTLCCPRNGKCLTVVHKPLSSDGKANLPGREARNASPETGPKQGARVAEGGYL